MTLKLPKMMDKPFVDPIPSQYFSSPAVPLSDTANTSYFGTWGDIRCVLRKLPNVSGLDQKLLFLLRGEKKAFCAALLVSKCHRWSLTPHLLFSSSLSPPLPPGGG